MIVLARTLASRHALPGRPEDLVDARQACWEAAYSSILPAADRLEAALVGAQLAWQAGDLGFARQAYELAVGELLPLRLWPAHHDDDLRAWRAELADLPAQAADCAVLAGHPEQAVEALENGRRALWAATLPAERDRLWRTLPDLAAELDRARIVLDSPVPGAGAAGSPAEREDADRRQRAATAWQQALDAVRERLAFADFLRPATFERLTAGVRGPVVIVNAGDPGGYALVVSAGEEDGPPAELRGSGAGDSAVGDGPSQVDGPGAGESEGQDAHGVGDSVVGGDGPGDGAGVGDSGGSVRVVDLPGLNAGAAYERAAEWLDICRRAGDRQAGLREVALGRARLFDTLDWLWQVVGEPVLAGLGHLEVVTDPVDQWPRIWWCPVGPLGLLPLAAAGRHAPETVSDRVVSSYAASLADALPATHGTPPDDVRQLAAGVQDAPGCPRLTGVPAELHVRADHLPEPGRAQHLTGAAATRAALLDARPGHPWFHFAGPAHQDQLEAAASALVMIDGPVTIGELAEQPVAGDLASLLSVLTATEQRFLPDLALHLAAALRSTGYRHALGSLWNIADALAPALTDAVLTDLTAGGSPDADRAPFALHRAVAQLRAAVPGDPLVWAAFLHFGP